MEEQISAGTASIVRAFRQIQVPLMIVGPDGNILECNSACHRLFEFAPGELIGQPVSSVLPVKSIAELNAFITPPNVDANVNGLIGHRADGATVPLAAQITAWTDAERGLQHALVMRDVTADMAAAQRLKEERKLANSAIKGAHIGVFEYNVAEDSVIVSDIWRELLEIYDRDQADVQKAWRSRVHPEDIALALQPIDTCLAGISEFASCEYRLRSRSGSEWRWMRTDVSISQRNEEGEITRLTGAMTDITERKETENALRRSVEQFRSAFDHATIGKALVGLDGKFLRVNPALCEALGYAEGDLLRTDFQSVSHAEDLGDDMAKLERLKAGEIPAYEIEKRYIRGDGTVMWGLLSVGMVSTPAGEPDHLVAQIVDVTEQRRLNELKSEFVATVSHELRTPLTSVLNALDLLSTSGTEDYSKEAQRLIQIARENGQQLHALVNDILDFEKASAGRTRAAMRKRLVPALVDEALHASAATAETFGVRLRATTGDRSLTAYVDPNLFQQVISNLLSNAMKFADTGSTVDVKVEGESECLRVSVTNEGQGVPESFRGDIFKPFSQAAASSTRTRGGTGLGLTISKQIVEQTGGQIGYYSEPGGKTTFWFTVPVRDPG